MGLTGRQLGAKLRKAVAYGHHTAWCRIGPVREHVAARMPPLQPPVLLLSLPRSGSTWVGKILGCAPNALYLEEPLTQTLQANGPRPTLIEPDDPEAAAMLRAAAADAFGGLPGFRPRVIRVPSQWALRRRRRARVVIKEVNPLLCEWLLREYRPRVIFLVRHPAAVCLSYRRLGWLDREEFQMAADGPGESPWRRNGRRQAYVLHRALGALRRHPERVRIVRYEEVCLRPVEQFRRLYEFARLDWTGDVERAIETSSSIGGDRSDAYATTRDSRRMAWSWRSEIQQRELDEVMAGYAAYDLPWYRPESRPTTSAGPGFAPLMSSSVAARPT